MPVPPLRVDFICGSYPPAVCGVADYTIRLALSLKPLGVEPRIVTSRGADECAVKGLEACGTMKDWTTGSCRKLAKWLLSESPDIVHIQFPTEPFYGEWGIHLLPLFLKKPVCRVVTTLHEYCLAPRGGRLKQILNARFSDRLIVTSSQDEAMLARWTSASRISHIPIGSNISRIGARETGISILRSLGVEDDAPALLFFGFARPGKGLDAAVAAVGSASSDARLIVCSPEPDPSFRAAIERVAASAGMTDRLIWAGYRDELEVSSIMLACDAAVLPFSDGASPRRGTLLAALCHGLPVISTSSEATPVEFKSGVNMLLSSVGDLEGLSSNISLILKDKSLAADISNRALEFSRLFDWDRIARQTYDVYRSLAPYR